MTLALRTACFLSGVAGLMYEIAWLRLGVLLYGATATATAIVLAGFLGGIGLGSYLGGRMLGAIARPLRVYGWVELGIGACALGLLGLQHAFPVGEIVAPGMLERVLIGLGALGPPTLLMGMTMPLLVRIMAHEPSATLASLYALNTLGAIVGATAGGFLLLERIGPAGTQWAALLCNVTIGGVALALSRSRSHAPNTDAANTLPLERATRRGGVPMLGLCAALLGFVAMALQVLLTRALDLLSFSTVYAFTAILAIFLVGIALGSGLCARRVQASVSPRAAIAKLMLGQGSWLALSPLLLATIGVSYGAQLRQPSAYGVPPMLLGAALLLALPPTLLSGAAFPLLVRASLVEGRSVGMSVGYTYLTNTIGSVIGSIAGGFWLLPRLGLANGLSSLAALALVGAVLLSERRAHALALAALVLLCGYGLSSALQVRLPQDLYANIGDDWQVVAFDDHPSGSVMVARSRHMTDRMGLWLDGNYVAGTGGGHLLLAHLPMLRHPAPRSLLGACMGTGQTFGAMAAYPIERVDLVELSSAVVRMARTHFARFDRGLFTRPNVRIHLGDARQFVRQARAEYDVITAEPLQPWTRGTVALYSREYYRAAARALRPSGIAVQWIPLYEVSRTDLRGIVATFRSVFPDVELWLDARDVILLGSQRLPPWPVSRASQALRQPFVRADLERIHMADPLTLLSRRVLGPAAVTRFSRGARLITDADPYLELTAPRSIGRDTEWQHLHDFVAAWDLDFGGGADAARLREAAIATREGVRAHLAEHAGADATDLYLSALAHYPNHVQLFQRTASRVDRDARAGHPLSLARYARLLELRPDFGPGWANLGLLALSLGDPEQARRAFEQALRVAPELAAVIARDVALLERGQEHPVP